MLTILEFSLIAVTKLSNISIVSMLYSIFPLCINEAAKITYTYSSSITMWLVFFVHHSCVIPSAILFLDSDIFDLLIRDMIGNLFEGITLILAINIVNIQWPFFFKCFTGWFRDLRIYFE